MDVFALREQLVNDYADYAESFLNDPRRADRASTSKRELDEGLLWPEPSLQLNPAFEPGGTIDELVAAGTSCTTSAPRIFRAARPTPNPAGEPLSPAPATSARRSRPPARAQNYVLTTGTGSGKSLAYIVPIVDHVLRHGRGTARIKAIVVYPMNALANSQRGELGEVPRRVGYPEGERARHASRRYTGQETDEEREAILRATRRTSCSRTT